MAGFAALKEKLLLSFGIVCILIGAMGISAVGVAYYYTDNALNELPNDIEWLLLLTNQTTTDLTAAIRNASVSMMTAAEDLYNINILGLYRPFEELAIDVSKAAIAVWEVADNVSRVSGYLEDLKNIMLDEISSFRLTAQISFGWIGILHALFIVMGVSILHIRKSLLSYIMKEKLLLSFGIVCILIGAMGVGAVGVGYYYTAPALNELPSDIERLYAVTNQTTTNATIAVYSASGYVAIAAYVARNFPVFGEEFIDTSNSLLETAASINQVGDDVKMVNGYLEELRNILLDEMSSIRLTIEVAFGWIGVVHALFIVIGVSILRIRKSLQSVINMNKTQQ